MNLDDFVKYIKLQGCRVVLYKKKNLVNNSRGTFYVSKYGPIICLALKSRPKKEITSTILHEYGHFLQWKDGYMDIIDNICDYSTLIYDWVKGSVKLTDREITIARNANLAMEWDAEMRGLKANDEFNLDNFNYNYYIKSAYAYMISIKWSWDNKIIYKNSIPARCVKFKKLTLEELFAPLTPKEHKIADLRLKK